MKKYIILKINQELIVEIVHETLIEKISKCFSYMNCEQSTQIIPSDDGRQIFAIGLAMPNETDDIYYEKLEGLSDLDHLLNHI